MGNLPLRAKDRNLLAETGHRLGAERLEPGLTPNGERRAKIR